MKKSEKTRWVLAITVLILTFGFLFYHAYTASAPNKNFQQVKTDDIWPKTLLEVINAERQANGLAPLVENASLDKVALSHAQDMQNRHYYNHNTPEGVTPYQRISSALGTAVYSGENEDNVCYNADTVNEFERFKESPEHNANQLDARINSVGIGYVHSESNQCNGFLVLDFAQI